MGTDLNNLTPEEIYDRYIELSTHYTERDAAIAAIEEFYAGTQWETGADETQEQIRVVLNYARRAVLQNTTYLASVPPRVDVIAYGDDTTAGRRERFLRSLMTPLSLWGQWQRLELDANKYGYGVVEMLWDPGKRHEVKNLDLEGGSHFEYRDVPLRFKVIPPCDFYPRYRTFDNENDFLYVIRYDPGRLVEDVEEQFGVTVQATDSTAGSLGTCDLVEFWTAKTYTVIAVTAILRSNARVVGDSPTTPHPVLLRHEQHAYGRPPFFVLPNLGEPHKDPTLDGSQGVVDAVKPLNQHLNLIFSLMGEEIATRIHPPVVYRSDQQSQDPHDIRVGAGEVIGLRTDENIETLDWKGVPTTVVEHRNATIQAIRDMGDLARTALGESGAESGIGQRLSNAALEQVLALKLPYRVRTLTDLFACALQTVESKLGSRGSLRYWGPSDGEGISGVELSKEDVDGNYQCQVRFNYRLPRDKIEYEQHQAYLYKMGLQSLVTTLEQFDHVLDPEQEAARIRQDLEDPVLHPERVAAQGKPSGQPGQGEVPMRFNAAPPVPTTPAMPTQQNAPYLQRGTLPNMVGGPQPGVYQGPPIEGQP